jgi:predicted nucleic acid-binding protein
MNTAIIDASVVPKWVLDEEDSDIAASLKDWDLAAPDLLLAECANVLWTKVRKRELTPEEVVERVQLLQHAPLELVPLEALVREATKLALQLSHPVYDCIYLALAEHRDLPLVTADRGLVDAVRGNKGEPTGRVLFLKELARRDS